MKTMYFVPFIICIIISCSNKKIDNNQSKENPVNINDTVYVKTDSTIILESLYLNLDSIKIGDTFTDKDEKYGYFRLLFSSSEETQSVYVEKIDIIGDGLVKLGRRYQLSAQLFGDNLKTLSVEFVSWETPEVIKINLDGTIINLNLTTMIFEKAVRS